jgi:hypothetical protein
MPKSKPRRKAGEKAVKRPGRQRAEPPGWMTSSRHHRSDNEEAGGLSPLAPQKDTADLPLFAATTDKPVRG